MQIKFSFLNVFTLLTLVAAISGGSASSAMIDTGEKLENLRIVKREKTVFSDEAAEIDIKPDAGATAEEEFAAAENPVSVNGNFSPEDSMSETETEQNEGFFAAQTVVTDNSFGNIKIGMTVAQASQAFGTELIAPNGKGDCYYVKPKKGFKGVDFMVIDGVIARIDVASKKYATDKGAKIGDPEAKIKSLYKNVEVHPQKYDEKLHDMEVYSADKKYLIIFETDGKVVTGFRAGRAEETSWVERCG